MLLEIYINNFILIDEMRLEFGSGLNILTGETGAGKSIIIDALSLIMGDRIKTDYVRDTSRKAVA
jgi:DNA repair protein RecN (Recombination protein N)